jgi:hypothetical protein
VKVKRHQGSGPMQIEFELVAPVPSAIAKEIGVRFDT